MKPNDLFVPSAAGTDSALAAVGDVAAAMRVGYSYVTGTAGTVNCNVARGYFRSVVGKYSPASAWLAYLDLRDSRTSLAAKNSAVQSIAQRAVDGDPVAVTLHGRVCELGLGGTVKRASEASDAYSSAQLDFALAQTYLGTTYLRAGKVEQGRTLLAAAATAGETSAMVRLAESYLSQRRPQTRIRDAKVILRGAVRRNDPAAMYRLGTLYYRDGSSGNAVALAAALQLFKRSAAVGFKPALAALGLCYSTGAGVDKNLGIAEIYLKDNQQYLGLITYDMARHGPA